MLCFSRPTISDAVVASFHSAHGSSTGIAVLRRCKRPCLCTQVCCSDLTCPGSGCSCWDAIQDCSRAAVSFSFFQQTCQWHTCRLFQAACHGDACRQYLQHSSRGSAAGVYADCTCCHVLATLTRSSMLWLSRYWCLPMLFVFWLSAFAYHPHRQQMWLIPDCSQQLSRQCRSCQVCRC